ncbi:response regulator [Stieleria sp. JC731]|uniref:response regulator n=1 Tax=Pirellulaceae TaxID=2691357 RepID=UPI001E33DADF|nr:response regulator [Stieleria sp. JC731]MCC9600502.1 response regulator [Stieleria sp. JC731]
MKSLVIDDSRAMRRILRMIMSSLGFDVIEAGDGQEGLEKFTSDYEDIEVVLVDWNMPVMNGLEFVKAVRQMEHLADKKLMMVTTETEPAQMARALMAGVDEFVMKPFTKEILVEKLRLIGVGLNTADA